MGAGEDRPPAAMAASSSRSLAEVQRRVSRVHHGTDPEEQLRFYDGWAPDYEQVLTYAAPALLA